MLRIKTCGNASTITLTYNQVSWYTLRTRVCLLLYHKVSPKKEFVPGQ